MDWMIALHKRTAEPHNLTPYQLATAMEGTPLSEGRRLYALADVLGVEPGDLITDLTRQYADKEAVDAQLAKMEQLVQDSIRRLPR